MVLMSDETSARVARCRVANAGSSGAGGGVVQVLVRKAMSARCSGGAMSHSPCGGYNTSRFFPSEASIS
jgi:hypothetical protein